MPALALLGGVVVGTATVVVTVRMMEKLLLC